MKRLAVYCGSASPEDPRYIGLAYDVGKALAERGIGTVYGGGRLGLMGAVARGALDAGGEAAAGGGREHHLGVLKRGRRPSTGGSVVSAAGAGAGATGK